MQRNAVHGGRHAVLADAVVDEARRVVGSRHRRHPFWARVVLGGAIGRAARPPARPREPDPDPPPFLWGRVLSEPVRSAEPPIISGTVVVRIPSAFSEATRVAISFGVLASSCLNLRTASSRPSGRSPLMRRANSLRWSIG